MQDLTDAVAHHNAGRLDEARQLYERALQRNPENSDAWHLLGMIHLRSGTPERALAHIQRALALHPTQPIVFNNLANVLGQLEEIEQASNAYERALHIAPDGPIQIHHGWTTPLSILKRHEKAITILRRCLALYPADENTWTLLCYMAHQCSDYLSLTRSAAIATRLAPNNFSTMVQVGKHFMESGNLPAAHLFLTQAVKDHPQLPTLNTVLAPVEALLGDKDRALARHWRATNLAYRNLPQVLLPEISVDGVLDRIDAMLPPALRDRNCLIYPFIRFSLMGHLAFEPTMLKRLYRKTEQELVIITLPFEKHKKINKALYGVVMRDAHVIETDDISITSLSSHEVGIFNRRDKEYFIHGVKRIERDFYFHVINGGHRINVDPPDFLCELGERAEKVLGIPHDVPIVVLHMRESGYHSECSSMFSFRDVVVENYIDSIRYLIGQGYYVIRIGDSSMTRLPDLGPHVIDAPFHPLYESDADVHFLSKCTFMISCSSGPDDTARMFQRPVLLVNGPLFHSLVSSYDFELFAFKKYYLKNQRKKGALNFRQILDAGIPFMHTAAELEGAGFAVEDLSSAEILAVVREMDQMLRRGVSATETTPRFHELGIEADDRWRVDPRRQHNFSNWFGHARSLALLSDSYCEMTGFLSDTDTPMK